MDQIQFTSSFLLLETSSDARSQVVTNLWLLQMDHVNKHTNSYCLELQLCGQNTLVQDHFDMQTAFVLKNYVLVTRLWMF